MAEIRKAGEQAKWLRPDCKSQVALRYEDGRMVGIEKRRGIRSMPRTPTMTPFVILSFPICRPSLPSRLIDDSTQYLINPTGGL